MAPFDDTRKDSVRAALDRDQVAAAYLFGSQARGNPGPLSDVDVAVWASPGTGARQLGVHGTIDGNLANRLGDAADRLARGA